MIFSIRKVHVLNLMCLPGVKSLYFAVAFDKAKKFRVGSQSPLDSSLYKETLEMDLQRGHKEGLFVRSYLSLGEKNK